MGTLYLVGTPIGNLEDITLRALRILREVGVVAAEDTRVTARLLQHYQIATRLVSYHDFSRPARRAEILALLADQDVALVSDAGMPGLSDPGYRLVQEAAAAGIAVVPIPGPNAAVTALVASGLPSDEFLFLGFLPRRRAARRQALAAVAAQKATLVLYEAPGRLLALLEDLHESLGDRPLAIGRELTKLYEEIWRGSIAGALADFGGRERIRGELTLVVGGAAPDEARWSEARVQAALRAARDRGLSHKAASSAVAARSGWRPREVYELGLAEEGVEEA